MSVMPTNSSMNTATSSTMVLENSCRSSCRRLRIGSRPSGPKVSASDGLRQTVLPIERPDADERPGLTGGASVLRRLLFASLIVLGLAFAAVCYAEMFGVLRFE
jgi:hypothetical protein